MPVRERPFQRPRLILFAAVALLLLHLAPQLDPLRELAQVGTRGVAGFVLVGRGALVRVVGAPGVARARLGSLFDDLQDRTLVIGWRVLPFDRGIAPVIVHDFTYAPALGFLRRVVAVRGMRLFT